MSTVCTAALTILSGWQAERMAISPAAARSVTLGGQVLPLVSPARIYLCGITPYDVTHLGHAATFVWVDAATSIMRLAGIEAIVCRNVTDIDDHLTRAAAEHDSSYDEFAVTQEYLFDRDMAALGVRRPTHSPRARHFVDQVIQLAWALLESGHGYERDGQVYFPATRRSRAVGRRATRSTVS